MISLWTPTDFPWTPTNLPLFRKKDIWVAKLSFWKLEIGHWLCWCDPGLWGWSAGGSSQGNLFCCKTLTHNPHFPLTYHCLSPQCKNWIQNWRTASALGCLTWRLSWRASTSSSSFSQWNSPSVDCWMLNVLQVIGVTADRQMDTSVWFLHENAGDVHAHPWPQAQVHGCYHPHQITIFITRLSSLFRAGRLEFSPRRTSLRAYQPSASRSLMSTSSTPTRQLASSSSTTRRT